MEIQQISKVYEKAIMSNFTHRQAIEKSKKTVYNKHQNTTDILDYQAVITHICVAHKINCKHK